MSREFLVWDLPPAAIWRWMSLDLENERLKWE